MNIRQEANELGQAILNAIVCYGEGDNTADVLCNLQDEIYKLLRQPTKVKIFRENNHTPLPAYQTEGAACCDLHVDWFELKGHRLICHTGIHVELPEGYEMQIRPRSNLTKTKLIIANSPGTVDGDYRGEVLVIFEAIDGTNLYTYFNNYMNNGKTDPIYFPYGIKERCAQLLISRYETIEWQEVNNLEDLSETKRGFGGHGSTGK